MKKTAFLLAAALILVLTACTDHEDFAFAGTVIDCEICTSMQDLGYAVQLSTPDTVGADYHASDGNIYHNVVVVYHADRMLRDRDSISGRIFWDPAHSRSECNYHFRETTGDVPEACFSKLTVHK